MDADATSTLHRTGVSATDDSFKYIWFQVCPIIPENLHVASELFFCCIEMKKLGHRVVIGASFK